MSSTIVSSLRETCSVFTTMAVQWHRLIVQLPLMGQEQTNVEPLLLNESVFLGGGVFFV